MMAGPSAVAAGPGVPGLVILELVGESGPWATYRANAADGARVTVKTARAQYPRAARVTEAVVAAAQERGVLVYSGTGVADGVDGDTILLGPPFVVTDPELVRIADVLAESIEAATAGVTAGAGMAPTP